MSRIFVRSALDAPFYILLLVEMSEIFVQSKLQALFYILWSSKRAPVPLTFKEAKGKLISGESCAKDWTIYFMISSQDRIVPCKRCCMWDRNPTYVCPFRVWSLPECAELVAVAVSLPNSVYVSLC